MYVVGQQGARTSATTIMHPAAVRRYAIENTVKILVGNKSEKDSERAVSTDDARVSYSIALFDLRRRRCMQLPQMLRGALVRLLFITDSHNEERWIVLCLQRKAEDLGISFIETSAKEAINVDLVRPI